jgi:hypothetical protein
VVAVLALGALLAGALLGGCGGSSRASLSPSAAAEALVAIYKLPADRQACLTRAFAAHKAATRPLTSNGPATDADLAALGDVARSCIPATTLAADIAGGAGNLTTSQQACVRGEVGRLDAPDQATLLAGLAVPNALGDIQTALLGKITDGVLQRCHLSLPDITETDTTPTSR